MKNLMGFDPEQRTSVLVTAAINLLLILATVTQSLSCYPYVGNYFFGLSLHVNIMYQFNNP
jgi:hypothetical protein